MASPKCREVDPVLACFSPTDATQPKVAIVAHYVYDADKAPLGVYYTDETGELFDAAAGTVSLGACPTYQPDVEWEQLCDKLADGTIIEFMCRTITYFDTMGNPVDPPLVTTFEMDKVTPYTPVDPVDYSACCAEAYERYERVKLCEVDDRKLLLTSSTGGGEFSKLSLNNGELLDLDLGIPTYSAATGIDLENFLLYLIGFSGVLTTVDLNRETVVNDIPIFTNDGSPLDAAAASFNQQTGDLWMFNSATDSIYTVNVTTGESAFALGPYTNVGNAGTAMAINPIDGSVFVAEGSGNIYQIDPTGSSLSGTLVYTSPGVINGMTFDDQGNLYVGATRGDSTNFGEVNVIPEFPNGQATTVLDDWGPGTNSLAFYNVKASTPSCFHRKFRVTPEGDYEYISDHSIEDGTERTIFGFVDCCHDSSDSSDSNEPAPVETHAASFSSELTTGGANGTVPADTYAITVFNDSNDTIQVAIGGDIQAIPRRSSHNWFRDFETEQPFTAGAATVTALSGTLNATERVIFNYKVIS